MNLIPKTLAVLVLSLMLAACGGGEDDEAESGGGSSGVGTSAPVTSDPTAAEGISVPFDVSGTWTDTDVVGNNSCGLSVPAPGSSRTTEGILIEQEEDRVTLTGPPNILGIRTTATGFMQDDGVMVLSGSDGDASITLDLQATSDDAIAGTSQVVTGGCTYNFSNSLVRSG